MGDQANVTSAKGLPTKEEKANYVYRLLKAHSEQSQAEVREFLRLRQIPFKPFLVVNAIATKLTMEEAVELAKTPNVGRILYEHAIRPAKTEVAAENVNTVSPWGINHIHSPYAWGLGFRGQNVVIGGQDTGYDWQHEALKSNYRGWDGVASNHNYSWHDAIHTLDTNLTGTNPCGLDLRYPCDDGSHGTHTMGTMVGHNSADTIGVAPDAKWIGCRNMERGWGKPSTYIECFEWFLAPTDTLNQNPDPSKAPHVINNSWYCSQAEGCNPTNWMLMETAVNNLRASGVVVVVSAGNSGPRCSSLSEVPAIFEGSFSVGAVAANDTLAQFSSRGPIVADGSGRIKPDVSAPGVAVYSSIPGNNYALNSGTSMAGPHVAGVVAILISARPHLSGDVDAIENIIRQSARRRHDGDSCNVQANVFPNTTYGWGVVDIQAMLQSLPPVSIDGVPEVFFNIIPNPSDGLFKLDGNPNHLEGIKVFDLVGNLIKSYPAIESTIDLSQYPRGIYIVQLKLNSGSTMAKKVIRL